MASTVIPPALFSTNLASKPRPLANRTATRCPFHSLGKYPAKLRSPPLSAYDLRASYPYVSPSRPSWAVKRRQARYKRPLEVARLSRSVVRRVACRVCRGRIEVHDEPSVRRVLGR